MKNTLLIVLVLCVFSACKDDDGVNFDVPVEFRKVEFHAVSGGALMRYYVENPDVYGVRVRYRDAWGELRTREGSYLGDSLLLTGFTEARQNVPAQVSFFNRSMAESESVEMTFNTEKSATVALFDDLKIREFWGGFSVSYLAPENTSGMVHVFYMGKDPWTGKPDTILMSSTPIKAGGDTLNFEMKQVMDATDVIVRTDDFEGKRVKLHVEKGLPCLSMDTLKYSNDFLFEFGGTTVTNLEYGLGADYLFDGDKYGLNYRRNRLAGERYKYNTYVVGPHAFYNKEEGDKNRFILDLKQERVPAGVFIYAFLNYRTSWPYSNDRGFSEGPEFLQDVWKGYYISRLPAKAKLYGTNSMNPQSVDLASCTLLSELDDDIDGVFTSWAARSDCNNLEIDDDWMKGDEEELLATEPVVLRMLCNYEEGRKFRYLILVVTDTYNSTSRLASMKEVNSREFVTFNEMEVCVKAE